MSPLTRTHDWSDVDHILCVRLDNMGDVLMSTPAMRALRQSGRARRRLTLLGSPAGCALAPHLPLVDECIAYEAAWSKNGSTGNAQDLAAIERLRRSGAQAAVIFTVYSQSPLPAALLCHLAGIPRVLAYCRENPYRLISHWQRETEPEGGWRHEVQRQLDLVAAVGAHTDDTRMAFHVRQADRAALAAKLRAIGAPPRGWIAVHGGATAASRRYPAKLLAGAVAGLRRATGRPVVLLGGEQERALNAQLMRECGPGVLDLGARLSLGELGAAIEAADLLVCNNSGPAHIGAALGTPIVELYALTNPQHTPWRTPHRVLNQDVPCRNCYRSVCPQGHHACLAGVPPEQVVRAACELLGRSVALAASTAA
ncbi:glycosyltransferase family 9 protein [Orrella sp. JC864]|uniref:glycosyltransferase family 9 protein n=1 Tax=Orrella sp. JC864 TaxID=3120298 RepID=UPI0012BCD462